MKHEELEYKRTFWAILFPLGVKIPKSIQREVDSLADKYDMCGEDMVGEGYEIFTGRSLLIDTLIGASLGAAILAPIIIGLIYIFC
jgi:hypothetical protein